VKKDKTDCSIYVQLFSQGIAGDASGMGVAIAKLFAIDSN